MKVDRLPLESYNCQLCIYNHDAIDKLGMSSSNIFYCRIKGIRLWVCEDCKDTSDNPDEAFTLEEYKQWLTEKGI